MERDTIFYLRHGESSERAFISGVIVGGGVDDAVVQFTHDGLGIATDSVLKLHYKHDGKFLQREFLVTRVTEDENGTRVKLIPQGADPEDADLRGSERIATIYESITACVGGQPDFVVLDVSAAGLAILGDSGLHRDDVKDIEMDAGDQHFVGRVKIRSAIEIRPGRCRYGVRVEPDEVGHNLSTTLPDLWVQLQIKYLETILV